MAYNYDDDDDNVEFNPEDFEGDEINDIDQLFDLAADFDDGSWDVYEFHGTGDTGGGAE